MAKVKYIFSDLYHRGVFVFLGGYDELLDWAKKEFTEPKYKEFLEGLEESAPGGAADCHYSEGSTVIRLDKFPETPYEISTLAHEALHATMYIMKYSGVEFIWDGINEAYTYFLEWLTNKALEKDGYEDIQKEEEQ